MAKVIRNQVLNGVLFLQKDDAGNVFITFEDAELIVKSKTPFSVDGQFYIASVFGLENSSPCEFCSMDCLCKRPLSNICTDLEYLIGEPIIINLMHDYYE